MRVGVSSPEAAEMLYEAGQRRSSASRAYFAAYAAAHALALRDGREPPQEGNWPHRRVLSMIRAVFVRRSCTRWWIKMMINQLNRAWTTRVAADYMPDARRSLIAARRLRRFAERTLA